MNKRFRDIFFFLICFFLVFYNIPRGLRINFLGGPIARMLVFYPIIIGGIYTLWYEKKYNNLLFYKKEFLKFIMIYTGITFLSLILGLAYYPFFGEILSGPIEQIEKLPKLLVFFSNLGFKIQVETLLPLWMIARMIKGYFLELVYTFCASYMFFCWYYDDWKKCFKISILSVISSLCLVIIYSLFIELPYLVGDNASARILEIINPYLHPIKEDGKWYPPLLWENQLRSIFSEPSHFGMYTSFAMPFLWYLVYKDRIILGSILTLLLTFLLFLTKARTGFMLFLGEIVLLLLFIGLFARHKDCLKKTGLIILCSLVVFTGSNYFIANYVDKRPQVKKENIAKRVDLKKSMVSYIDSNATSLANPDKRSNRARYSIMEADFRIGMDHPILGVGRGLRNGYIPQYLPEKGKQNGEVKMWLEYREKLGILKSGFPSLGEYTVRFGETGILGLLVFLAPVLFLIFSMIKKIKDDTFQYKLEYGMFLISLLGIMASGIGDSLNITYCYWVLLGLGYAMCFGKAGDEKDINERT